MGVTNERGTVVTAERTLHLVDLENLAGGTRHSTHRFVETVHRYREVARCRDHDIVIAACECQVWRQVAFELPEAWRCWAGYGPDGADLALLEAAPIEWVTGRFQRLVIGSGDHAFVPLVLAARIAGLEATVVSRTGSIHHLLYRAADRYMPLGTDETVIDLTRESTLIAL